VESKIVDLIEVESRIMVYQELGRAGGRGVQGWEQID
jgi:hypothetical protein